MHKRYSSKKGFTLTETIVSMILFAIVWLTAVEVVVIGKVSGSIAKHKTQAAYVAQRAMEDLHKIPFAAIVNSNFPVIIDDRGTPNILADDLMGTRIITVTNPSPFYRKAVIEVRWNEKLIVATRIMSEWCASFIANDTQLN